MQYILFLLLITTTIFAKSQDTQEDILSDITLQGNIDLTTQAYLTLPEGKHPENITASATLEMAYSKDDLSIKAKLYAQQDSYDFYSQPEQNHRSFLRLDELYVQYDFENDEIMFGKNIRFWGALEVRNITDGFNSEELRGDPFQKDKLGSWNVSYSHFTDDGEFSAIVKFYEQDRKMSSFPYVYYFFPESIPVASGVEIPYVYKDTLVTENGQNRPTVYLKYSATADTEYALDYAIIFENGYDSQRYYTAESSADGTEITTQEHAYLVNKIMTYNTLVIDSTLYKLEALYTDVINNSEISDYYHLGLGVEHTLSQIYEEADLGLISEYYYYGTLEGDKRGDLALFELFQNDLFLGARYSFNDSNDASIVGGAILDLDYNEQVYYIEYEGRVGDVIKVNFDYRFIDPSPEKPTAFHLMGRHERVSLKLGYYF